ncbi:MAG: hypothetical protein LH614_09335 [Pyrinomonadaceae bacterium]|nr:hypothetical protein [Pyrinomonadaceae bacterium]
MEKIITFEITESQAEKFEKMLDATLEILNRMEKESPERAARFDKHHEDFMRNLAETKKIMERTEQRMAKWGIPLEK